ncbi:MAG TPA: hypothetical protein VFE63_14110 [Roseiarcus sp.]|nr:hypothetical protein [Roseiarcus sp.]
MDAGLDALIGECDLRGSGGRNFKSAVFNRSSILAVPTSKGAAERKKSIAMLRCDSQLHLQGLQGVLSVCKSWLGGRIRAWDGGIKISLIIQRFQEAFGKWLKRAL